MFETMGMTFTDRNKTFFLCDGEFSREGEKQQFFQLVPFVFGPSLCVTHQQSSYFHQRIDSPSRLHQMRVG